jgi:hypothetical protein
MKKKKPVNVNQKSKLLEKIKIVAANVSGPVNDYRIPELCFAVNEILVCFAGDNLKAFNAIVTEMLRIDTFRERFSEQYIRDLFARFIIDILSESDDSAITRRFDQVIASLEDYALENTAYIPITGIELEMERLSIGNITLRKMTKDDMLVVSQKFVEMDNVARTSEEKKAIQQSHEKFQNIISNVCAEFTTIAEPYRVQERAIEETRRITEIFEYAIRSAAIVGNKPAEGMRMGIAGDFVQGERSIFVISQESINSYGQRLGPIPFLIDSSKLEIMHRAGVFYLASLLQKPQSSDFEKALLYGVHWFSSSRHQVEKENRLLNLIACLESLLMPEQRVPIASTIAEGLALTLGEGKTERYWIRDLIRKLYDARSKISHGGRESVLNADLNSLELLTCSFIKFLLDNRDLFKHRKDIIGLLDDIKFGASLNSALGLMSPEQLTLTDILRWLALTVQKSLNAMRIPLEMISVPARFVGEELIEDADGDLTKFNVSKYSEEYYGIRLPASNVYESVTEFKAADHFTQTPSRGDQLWLLKVEYEPMWLINDFRLDLSSGQKKMINENFKKLTTEEVVKRGKHLDYIIQWLKQNYLKIES